MDTDIIVHGQLIIHTGHITGQDTQFIYKLIITIQPAGIMKGLLTIRINLQTIEKHLLVHSIEIIVVQADIHIKMGTVLSVEPGLRIPSGI